MSKQMARIVEMTQKMHKAHAALPGNMGYGNLIFTTSVNDYHQQLASIDPHNYVLHSNDFELSTNMTNRFVFVMWLLVGGKLTRKNPWIKRKES